MVKLKTRNATERYSLKQLEQRVTDFCIETGAKSCVLYIRNTNAGERAFLISNTDAGSSSLSQAIADIGLDAGLEKLTEDVLKNRDKDKEQIIDKMAFFMLQATLQGKEITIELLHGQFSVYATKNWSAEAVKRAEHLRLNTPAVRLSQ